MAITLKKIAKNITLDLKDVPTKDRDTVRKEVGEFVIDEILRSVSTGNSPVNRRGKFKKLNAAYAKSEKGGNRTANLELFGDMLDSLTLKNTIKGVSVGIFSQSEIPKADGHNNFSGKSTLPTRRFIPKGSESFTSTIEKGIKGIVDEFRKPSTSQRDSIGIGDVFQSSTTTALTLNDLFSDESLDAFLESEGFI